MNANYSEAIEQQAAALTSVASGESGDSDIRKLLVAADTYYLSKELSRLLETVSQGLLDWRVAYEELPTPFGFVWLEEGWQSDELFVSRESGIVTALAWSWFQEDENSELFLRIVLFANHYQHATPYPERYVEIADGNSIREWRGTDLAPCVDLKAVQLLACLWQFVRQQIVTVASEQHVERHVRKRLERDGWKREPVVRVVKLRQTHIHQPDRAATSVDWACQWLVRGHWRQQPYPKTSTVRPKWITPYVKGPEDKPLKPPRATVFAVVR